MFTDRDIKGIWVASEGVVYQDFNKDIHYIKDLSNIDIVKYFCGVDFGWEHFGSMVVVGKDINNNYYLIKEYAYQHKDIDDWINIAKDIKAQYGNINFYCDHARPDYIDKLKRNNIRAINANKEVLEGISMIATLFKTNKLFILEDNVDIFKKEIYNYVWKNGKDEPVKTSDDVLDSLRYAIYSDSKRNGKTLDRNKYNI
jgi:PBSX family phage terminase large subunit